MNRRLFVTGATGFVGRHLLSRLAAQDRDREMVALVRGEGGRAIPGPAPLRVVVGDLRRPESYAAALDGVHTVIHVAATTGAASESDHFAVNAEGTRALAERAAAAGVRRFVLVSSIAVTFPDTRRYPYARSKQAAEQAVRRLGIGWIIVRPTIVLGRGSPVLAGLRRLAGLRIIPIFGPGTARVQPIDVDDLAILLTTILEAEALAGEIVELGGPEVLTIEELLQEIRRLERGARARTVHLPAGPIAGVAWLSERVGLRPPVTAGQLCTFLADGIASRCTWLETRGVRLTPLSDTLRRSLADGNDPGPPA